MASWPCSEGRSMNATRPLLLLALILGCAVAPATAQADEEEAETCVQAKVRDSYAQGWSVRTTTTASLGQGDREVYVLTLHSGNSYRVLACADQQIEDVDIVVYDADGKPVASDQSHDREPVVEIVPPTTGKYYVAVFASAVKDPAAKGGLATAVTYK